MKIAIMTFDGFNELDSFVASAILNRIQLPGWKAEIVAPTETVTSMNGVQVRAQQPLSFANEADVVLFGSGIKSREISQNATIMSALTLSPERQLIGSQCSGALFLHHLNLVNDMPICADLTTRPFLEELGATVINKAFNINGNIATAGGCLSSQYLAMWVIASTIGIDEAKEAIRYVAPVGQQDEYVDRAVATLANGFNGHK